MSKIIRIPVNFWNYQDFSGTRIFWIFTNLVDEILIQNYLSNVMISGYLNKNLIMQFLSIFYLYRYITQLSRPHLLEILQETKIFVLKEISGNSLEIFTFRFIKSFEYLKAILTF